jgi:hypothetical protein
MDFRRTLLALSVAVILVPAGSLRADAAPQDLIVRVYDVAGLQPGRVSAAIGVVDRILGRAGITAAWVMCSAEPLDPRCTADMSSLDLLVRLQPGNANAWRDVCGIAVRLRRPDEGHLITIFMDCVSHAADTFVVPTATALAYCLAHEIGHQLLPTVTHGPAGLMAPSLTMIEWRQAAAGRLQFSDEEAARMRAGVAARSRTAGIVH